MLTIFSYPINITRLGKIGNVTISNCKYTKLQVYKNSRAEDQEYHPLGSLT